MEIRKRTGSHGFTIEDLPEGRTLVVTGPWTAGAVTALGRDDVDGVWLNYTRGFSEPDLAFLESWPIRRLNVLDPNLTDLEPPRASGQHTRRPHGASRARSYRGRSGLFASKVARCRVARGA